MLLPFSGLTRVRVMGWSNRPMREGDYMLLADGAGGVVRHRIESLLYYVEHPNARWLATLVYAA